MSVDWTKGVITIVPKKGDVSICSNNRGITLRCTASKLLQIVILQRLSNDIEKLLRENQCSFRKGRSCTDLLYSIRTIIENCIEYSGVAEKNAWGCVIKRRRRLQSNSEGFCN